MPVLTLTGFEVFNPVDGQGNPRGADMAQVQLWATEVEKAIGFSAARVVTAAGDIAIGNADTFIIVAKTVAAPTTVNLPASAGFGTNDLVIKDGKGDAETNAITIVPLAPELIDGEPSIAIAGNYGICRLSANPAGGWWLLQFS